MSINRVFLEREISCPTGEKLHALIMAPPRGPVERLVYLVPLVGSGASQQILMFKGMAKRGSALLSFEYRGHGRSTGTFSVEKSLEDARTVYDWACAYADERGLPLHVLSNCYGTLAMLSWFRGGGDVPLPATIGAISGLIDMHQIIRIDDFAAVYARVDGRPALSGEGLLNAIAAGAVDIEGAAYRHALKAYLQELFPELQVTSNAFEQLPFHRVDMGATVRQFFTLRPLATITVPSGLPCLFFYGLRDDLMGLDLPGMRQQYEQRLHELVPHAEIRAADVDHFGRGMDRDGIVRQLGDFHLQNDHRASWKPALASNRPVTR